MAFDPSPIKIQSKAEILEAKLKDALKHVTDIALKDLVVRAAKLKEDYPHRTDNPTMSLNQHILLGILYDGFDMRKKYENEIPLDLLINLIMLEEFVKENRDSLWK